MCINPQCSQTVPIIRQRDCLYLFSMINSIFNYVREILMVLWYSMLYLYHQLLIFKHIDFKDFVYILTWLLKKSSLGFNF